MKTLSFSVTIAAPRRAVWDTMLSPDGYRAWTAPFMEGSHFEGSWAQGQKMRFLAPGDQGMVGIIEENRLHEHVSIRHVGEINAGVEDTSSPKVMAWAPAYEKYTFVDTAEGTRVTVDVDSSDEHESFMRETFPKALQALKQRCETGT